jgi:endonuclease/exonuclease/phosphatase family metal-dependent hydrolase
MIKIVSHNACWFQGFPYEALDPDAAHTKVLDRLTSIYRSHSSDVVCIQEVQHAKMADVVASRLKSSARYTRGGAYPVYGCATFANKIGAITESGNSASPAQRAWQISNVALADAALNIGNVHLSSDRFIGEAAAADARVEDLRAMLNATGQIDVICGDFNEGPREACALLLEQEGFVDAAIATDASLPSTGVGKDRSDQIWVRDELETAIAGFGATAWDDLAFNAPGKDVLSDHLPLWLELRT